MTKAVLTGVLVAVMGLTNPSLAQQRPDRPPLSQIDEFVIGLPIFSSDGVRMGVVTEVGTDDGEPVIVAEIDQPLGIGAVPVAIPTDMFVHTGQAIKLTITASEVRRNLGDQGRR